MSLVHELIAYVVADHCAKLFREEKFDFAELAHQTGLCILSEIQQVILNEEFDDFDAIEEIVCIMEKHNLNTGFRHDFG